MKRLLPLLFIVLCSCHSAYYASGYNFQEQKIAPGVPADTGIMALIQPYKDSLDKEMKTVLGVADESLSKTQPESDLGNFMCDLLLQKARVEYGDSVDFTVLNYGGIRLPSLPKGDITVGEMTELMPFDNRMVIMRVSGYTVDTLFQHMAANGGWPVSGAQYTIRQGKATGITIYGKPLDHSNTYLLAISDYLAQGGDNCNMLKGLPYTDTKETIREVLIEGVQQITAKGQHIRSKLDGRIQLAP